MEVELGKLILITGGARSGKSTFAEKLAREYGDSILYIATSIPLDEEMKARIEKHKNRRPSSWETVETFKDMDINLKDRIKEKQAVLLDCLTIMTTNLMLEKHEDWENVSTKETDDAEKYVSGELTKLLQVVEESSIPFIVVTNEVGMGVVPFYNSARVFRDIAGRANQLVAAKAEEVYLCVSGIPVKIK